MPCLYNPAKGAQIYTRIRGNHIRYFTRYINFKTGAKKAALLWTFEEAKKWLDDELALINQKSQ